MTTNQDALRMALEKLNFIIDREDLTFAECSLAEEIIGAAREAYAALSTVPVEQAAPAAEQFCDGNCTWLDHHPDCEIGEKEADCIIGVGNGSGDLFVRGKYDAIKRVQSIILELDDLRSSLTQMFEYGRLCAAQSPARHEPFAYFQRHPISGTWEEVLSSAAGEEGVVAAYRAPIAPVPAALNMWREAVLDLCAVRHLPFHEDDPAKTLNAILSWEVDVALDPRVNGGNVLVPDAHHMTDEQGEAIAERAKCCGGIAYEIYRAAIAAAPPQAAPQVGAEAVAYMARRFCKGDNEWTDWVPITEEEYERRRGDRSFEVQIVSAAAPGEPAVPLTDAEIIAALYAVSDVACDYTDVLPLDNSEAVERMVRAVRRKFSTHSAVPMAGEREVSDEPIIDGYPLWSGLPPAPTGKPEIPDLTLVIAWLEGGRDPIAAAKELRLYQDKLAALSAPQVPEDPMIAAMSEVANQYAHKLALDLECILGDDYSGKWYDTAMDTVSAYRTAMNTIHERESPTFMGEPMIAASTTADKREAT